MGTNGRRWTVGDGGDKKYLTVCAGAMAKGVVDYVNNDERRQDNGGRRTVGTNGGGRTVGDGGDKKYLTVCAGAMDGRRCW